MDLEEQTLHYYIKVFSFLIVLSILLFYLYIFFYKKIETNSDSITILKAEKIENVLKTNINNISNLEIQLIKIYYFLNKIIKNKFIHFGDFNIKNISSIYDLLKIIYNPSNVLNKVTIIEGWSTFQLEEELSKYFDDYYMISYENIIADTYFFETNVNYNLFVNNLKEIKKKYFKKYRNNILLNKFSEDEILIIGSLIEKEGLDYEDKKKISSVILNRLNKNMKLQIDASVLFSITDGKYNLGRKLSFDDLKIKHPYNTYHIYGLPPKPISYVGKKTLDIIFENYKSDFLFYFFDNSLNRHIFSKNFEEHKNKLNDYRNNK